MAYCVSISSIFCSVTTATGTLDYKTLHFHQQRPAPSMSLVKTQTHFPQMYFRPPSTQYSSHQREGGKEAAYWS